MKFNYWCKFTFLKKSMLSNSVIFLSAWLVYSSHIYAQHNPTKGIELPDHSITTQSDAGSIEVNPAGLGFMNTSELSYGLDLPAEKYDGVLPRSHALFMAVGTGQFGFGFGAQWLQNPYFNGTNQNYRKYSFSAALSVPNILSFGATANYFSSRYNERLANLVSWDAGMQWRLNSNLGMGFLIRDFNTPFLNPSEGLRAQYGAGIALRAWQGRFVLDTEITRLSGQQQVTITPRILAEAIQGIRLFIRSMIHIDWHTDTSTKWSSFSGGLELSMGGAGFQAAARFNPQSTNGDGSFQRQNNSYLFWLSPNKQRSVVQPQDRWVAIDLQQDIAEQAVSRIFGDDTRSFWSILRELDAIVEDESISGVVFNIGNTALGYAQLWELRQQIQRIRLTGKHTISYLTATQTKDVYLASASDEQWTAPGTLFMPTGISAQFLSFPKLLDNLGIEAEFVRIGDYKTAPEQYLKSQPSEASREQTQRLLDQLQDEVTTGIAQNKELDRTDIETMFNQIPWTPSESVQQGFITNVGYDVELDDYLTHRFSPQGGVLRGYEFVEINDKRWGPKPRIALVHIDGVIVDGNSGRAPFTGDILTGSDTIIRTLRAIRNDPMVKAVIVRIDSPGGSATASDAIFRELRRTSQQKPVVASMGNVAASGGYYVAAGADIIFATPMSITGSIGIFAGKVNIQQLISNIGISYFDFPRHERAGLYNIFRPWSDSERTAASNGITYLYHLFLGQIASNRPLSREAIDALGRGRVWSGQDAATHTLVDQIGGLVDTIKYTENLLQLRRGEAAIISYPQSSSLFGNSLIGVKAEQLKPIYRIFLEPQITQHRSIRLAPQFQKLIKSAERNILWPLYFNPGEALMLPEYMLYME